jgi:hypothetical protein
MRVRSSHKRPSRDAASQRRGGGGGKGDGYKAGSVGQWHDKIRAKEMFSATFSGQGRQWLHEQERGQGELGATVKTA